MENIPVTEDSASQYSAAPQPQTETYKTKSSDTVLTSQHKPFN
jgi:hypothetical protein